MNTKKLLLGAAVGAALLIAAPMASACALTAWDSTAGTPIAGEPDDATPVARYAGRCGMQADAINDQVIDTTPTAEGTYSVRFYYFTGNRTGTADIFQGRSQTGGANSLPIRVQHDGNALIFNSNGSATTRTATVADNKWYAVELQWAAGAGTGFLNITVTGAGSATPVATGGNITGISNSSDTIDEARLGLIVGSGTGAVNFDAFDSRRTTQPGRLCRGDANNDGNIGAQDRIVITNEINAFGDPVSPGQPDANEDGFVGAQDRIVVTNAIGGFLTCSDV